MKEDNEWGTTPKKGSGKIKTGQKTKGQSQELQNRFEAVTPEDQGEEEEEKMADVSVEVAQREERKRHKGAAQRNIVNKVKSSGIPDLEDSDSEDEEDPNERRARRRNQEVTMWHRDPRPNISRKDMRKEAHAQREKRVSKDNEGFGKEMKVVDKDVDVVKADVKDDEGCEKEMKDVDKGADVAKTISKGVNILNKTQYKHLNNAETARYELIEITVDSGAEESVTPPDVTNQFQTMETESSKAGEQFVAANGSVIENEGERNVEVHTLDGVKRSMVFQVTTVNTALASVARMNEKGNIVVFDGESSYIQNKQTGEVIPLKKKQGTWVLEVWVEKEPAAEAGFGRQGTSGR